MVGGGGLGEKDTKHTVKFTTLLLKDIAEEKSGAGTYERAKEAGRSG